MGRAEWLQGIISRVPPSVLTAYRSVKRRHELNRGKRLFQRHLRSSDVFIVGHPKSGNTWVTYMLATVLYKDYEHRLTLVNLKEFIPFIHGEDDKIAHFPKLPDPRIFRNEYPVYPELYPKTIYLVRDPRAVLVSYYHHYRTVTNDMKRTLRDFVEEYIVYGCIRNFDISIVRWDRQVLEWIRRANKDGCTMIVKYEDMAHDRQRVLKKAVEFIGIPCAEEDVALATARGSFAAMRADEEQHGAESYPGEIGTRGRFIRRGKADGWREEMPSDLGETIEDKFRGAMEKVGYL